MTLTERVVDVGIRTALRLLCRVDRAQAAKVPDKGPLLLVVNHVNFLDIPLMYASLRPRPLSSFAKVETWDSPGPRFLANLWGAIPIRRGEADMAALRLGLEALEKGRILGVAPEGTRSGDGRLRQANAGIVFLALHSGAPLLPMVCYGQERFRSNVKRARRTTVHVAVGEPFLLAAGSSPVTRQVRQQMTDEVMYELAALLPPAYRGVYSDLSQATRTHLRPLG